MKLNILYEDNDILVCEKPIKVATQIASHIEMDMVDYVTQHISSKGSNYIGLIHRLDRGVGGVMVFAKSKFAASKLSEAVRENNIRKRYLAVIPEDLSLLKKEEYTLIEDYLVKDNRQNVSKIVNKNFPGAKKATLKYKIKNIVQVEQQEYSLVEIELITGRHHQIRVQMANLCGGLYGDTKYNKRYSKEKKWMDLGLYAYELKFNHPRTNKEMIFSIEPKHIPFSFF